MPMRLAEQVQDQESIIGIFRPPPPVRFGRRRSDKVPWAGVVILLIATVGLFFAKSVVPAIIGPKIPFELQASDVAGKMHIQWNGAADMVAKADSATLVIRDGKKDYSYPVTRDVLANGSLDYSRRTDEVEATLVLTKDGREIERRIVRSISAPAAH